MASLAESFVQSALSNQAPDIAGNFAKGAALAQRQQELDLQMQQHQQAQEQFQVAKQQKMADMYETYGKMADGPGKQFYGTKVIPASLNVMKMSQDMNPAVMDMMTRDPELGNFLVSKAKSGQTNTAEIMAAVKDPDKFAKLTTKLGMSTWADQKMLQGTAEAFAPQLGVAETEAANRASKEKEAALNRISKESINGDKSAAGASKDEQKFRDAFSNKVDSDLSPLIAQKTHINSALDAGNRVVQAQAAGKTPNSSDQTLLATGLATTISKRINPTEFENIMHIPGAENWSIDQWRKYVAGGTNMNVVNALMQAAKSQNEQIDQEIDTKRVRLESQVKTSKFADKADSIMTPMHAVLNTIPKPQGSGTIAYRGKSWSPAALKAAIAAHPNDPDIENAKAALVGGNP